MTCQISIQVSLHGFVAAAYIQERPVAYISGRQLKVTYIQVKVVPYTFVRRGVPVREDTYPGSSAFEVGWPAPFLAAFISPVLPPGTHLLLGEQ